MVLITLDTVRADEFNADNMPMLWRLLNGGTHFANAWSPSPLTLPAHTSMLTGMLPPEHGLRENGIGQLNSNVPLLQEIFSEAGYSTAAVIGSLVLDRRFGLARGFDHFDDALDPRVRGQYGDAERSAAQVTDAALAWWRRGDHQAATGATRPPRFLWAHYYDAHAPYQPAAPCNSQRDCYRAELREMDHQVARLLNGTKQRARVVAVVGDHGEAFGEHQEQGHGLFLYGTTLRVPMVLTTPGTAQNLDESLVSTHTLPHKLLAACNLANDLGAGTEPDRDVVFAETLMPLSTYGWLPLSALTQGQHRLIVRGLVEAAGTQNAESAEGRQPRSELYNLPTDPEEQINRSAQLPEVVASLAAKLSTLESAAPAPDRLTTTARSTENVEADQAIRSQLATLGYLSTTNVQRGGDGIDPLDGPEILAQVDRARVLLAGGSKQAAAQALAILRPIARRNPSNLPLLTQLIQAQLDLGENKAALRSVTQALKIAPDLHFVHLRAAAVHERLGRSDAAVTAYRRAFKLNPRSYDATLALAQHAARSGDLDEEHRILATALAAGLVSSELSHRLSWIRSQSER